MKRQYLWLWNCILIIGLLFTTSCDTENGPDENSTDTEYRSRIVGTRWQLSEMLYNGVWQKPLDYRMFDIPQLDFYSDIKYTMQVTNYNGHKYATTVEGTYSISDATITMNEEDYQGIAFQMKIESWHDGIIEGTFTVWPTWHQTHADNEYESDTGSGVSHYTIRLKQQ